MKPVDQYKFDLEFGTWLKAKRELLGWSASGMAQKMHVSLTVYKGWESGSMAISAFHYLWVRAWIKAKMEKMEAQIEKA